MRRTSDFGAFDCRYPGTTQVRGSTVQLTAVRRKTGLNGGRESVYPSGALHSKPGTFDRGASYGLGIKHDYLKRLREFGRTILGKDDIVK